MNGTVILLCNLTVNMAQPWIDGGYEVVMVDPQHPPGFHKDGVATKAGMTVLESALRIGELSRTRQIVFVAGFPPCTDMAVSGARWFSAKREADPLFQAKAVAVAEQCRMIGIMSGAPYFVENPVSVLASAWGKPDHTFHPHQFTGYCPDDNYTKRTCLWTGNGFEMPEEAKDLSLGFPDNRIHFCPPGAGRANIRSATPRGFAMAVYLANAPHLKAQKSLLLEEAA